MSEMHMGALVAMSMTSVDNTQSLYWDSPARRSRIRCKEDKNLQLQNYVCIVVISARQLYLVSSHVGSYSIAV